jgi:Asp-tRNA(Asn)/Glu-tRNA(Gln) amidotransferase A subunit family amidase
MTADLDLAYSSAVEQAHLVATGQVSPRELVANALARIDDVQPTLNCFSQVWAGDALAAADEAGRTVLLGAAVGPLHGVPIALKETTHIVGRPLTLGSMTHRDVIADRNAFITTAMQRAGAIVIGQTTSPEFAHTLQTDSPLWGATRNPWNVERTPGGSSGGSGAAVASGCVALAEGSDMGGSVRIPAAWCGIVGLKPGLGRIPMDVLPGLFDSISHHGPLARSVTDARLFLAAAQGPDDADIMSVTTPLDLSGPAPSDVSGMRLGLSLDFGTWSVHPEVRAAVTAAAEALIDAGAVVEEVDLQLTRDDEMLWVQMWGVFMSGYFGHLVDEFHDVMDPDVLQLIELGNSISATEYKRFEIHRTDVWRRISAVLAGREALLCPTMAQPPIAAAKAGRTTPEDFDDDLFHAEDMTGVFNLVAPCPALTVPCGAHGAGPDVGLPIGLQIVGRRWREDTVLQIGRAVELAMPQWGQRRPPM